LLWMKETEYSAGDEGSFGRKSCNENV
jgi:hypothetical protein